MKRRRKVRTPNDIITEEDFNEQTQFRASYPSEDSPGSDVTANEEVLLGIGYPDALEDEYVDEVEADL